MTPFDLLFLCGTLTCVVVLIRLTLFLARGRRDRALLLLRRFGLAGGLYFMAIVLTSVATARAVVPMGTAQCFDEWCITVVGAERAHDSVRATLELSSRSRGVTQGERDVKVYLMDRAGHEYLPHMDTATTSLSVQIPPGGRVTTTRSFAVPDTVRELSLLVAHSPFPHCCIIADRESLLHRRTVVPLP